MNTPSKAPQTLALLGTNLLGSPMQQQTLAGLHRVNYTPFGHTVKLPLGSIGFTGQVKDSATMLYLLGSGYRGYSTALLRFISSDSYSPFEKGGINAYAYCGAEPINRSDSSGESWSRVVRLIRMVQSAIAGRTLAPIARRRPYISAETLQQGQRALRHVNNEPLNAFLRSQRPPSYWESQLAYEDRALQNSISESQMTQRAFEESRIPPPSYEAATAPPSYDSAMAWRRGMH